MDSKWRVEQLKILFTMKGFLLVLCSIGSVLLFQNCSPQHATQDEPQLSAAQNTVVLQNNSLSILRNNCSSCHNPNKPSGTIIDITDVDELLYKRLVIPGEPMLSVLFTDIQGGTMPPNGPLSGKDVQTINDWIVALKTAPPSGTLPPPLVLVPNYAAINNLIIKPKCLNCHSSANAAGGVSFSTYAQVISTITPGQPATSVFYTDVQSNKMPPNNPLTANEVNAIMQWIQGGALNN